MSCPGESNLNKSFFVLDSRALDLEGGHFLLEEMSWHITGTASNDVVVQEAALAESRAALGRESAARRRLHNLVQELRGNIRVFVRVKPADAAGRGGAPVLACEDSHRISCTAAGSTKVPFSLLHD